MHRTGISQLTQSASLRSISRWFRPIIQDISRERGYDLPGDWRTFSIRSRVQNIRYYRRQKQLMIPTAPSWITWPRSCWARGIYNLNCFSTTLFSKFVLLFNLNNLDLIFQVEWDKYVDKNNLLVFLEKRDKKIRSYIHSTYSTWYRRSGYVDHKGMGCFRLNRLNRLFRLNSVE